MHSRLHLVLAMNDRLVSRRARRAASRSRSYYDRQSQGDSAKLALICCFGIGAILFVIGIAKVTMAVIDIVMTAAGIR